MSTDKTDTPRLSDEIVEAAAKTRRDRAWLMAIGQNLAADLLDARRELEAARARVAALEGLADILSGTLEAHTDRRRQDLQTLAAEREAHAALRARIEGLAEDWDARQDMLQMDADLLAEEDPHSGTSIEKAAEALRLGECREQLLSLLTPDPEPSTGGGS